ncbi:MAG: DEAD/DEAH box helicase [Candidatus Bathyarchaeia archaeon]
MGLQASGSSFNTSILRGAVDSTINYLKNRHHPEKPHISLVGPPHLHDYHMIWRLPKSAERHYDILEESEDELLEEFEESLKTRWPGWIFGSDFELEEEGGESWCADVRFNFYVRIKPDFDDEQRWDDSAYTHVRISLKYLYDSNFKSYSIEGKLLFVLEGGHEKAISLRVGKVGDNIALVIVPQPASKFLNKQNLEKILERIASIGLRRIPKIHMEIVYITSDHLSAEVYSSRENGQQNYAGKYHQAFCILLGYFGKVFKVYLVNLGGMIESKDQLLVREFCENPFRAYTYNSRDNMSRWTLGYLFETEGIVKFLGRKTRVGWNEYGLYGAHPANTLIIIDENEPNTYILRDYFITDEILPPIKKHFETADAYLSRLAQQIKITQSLKEELKLFVSALNKAFAKILKVKNFYFYTYQIQAIQAILASLGLLEGRQYRAVAITARTAGGKTYAFMIPILIKIFIDKIVNKERGVKAILVYPTKALANDQTEEIASLLFYLISYLREGGLNLGISFGCLHGNTHDLDWIERLLQKARRVYLPVKCPQHNGPIYVDRIGNRAYAHCPFNEECSFAQFLNEFMRKTREEIYFDPPDILITNEDMINRLLSGTSRERGGSRGRIPWYEWQLFGYPYKRCKKCSHTYPYTLRIQKCNICEASGNEITQVDNLCKPEIIVLDEAHQINGSFGIQVHHMLSLLEYILGYKPLYVLSSATFKKADELASRLLNLNKDEIYVIEAETEDNARELTRRFFALLMPKAYTMDATVTRLLTRFHNVFFNLSGYIPKGIIFTNTLGQNNELISYLRNLFAEVFLAKEIEIDGHSTDYEEDRAEKELLFKEGRIDLFVATSTLELGVDYGMVDFVTIYGVPAKISSFVQRIGRAGRNKDAVIFVVFDPENPLNYSYYENYRILCDGSLRDRAIGREVIEISPMNNEAIKRAFIRWIVAEIRKICSQNSRLCRILINDLETVHQRQDIWGHIIDYIASMKALPQSLLNLSILPSSQQILSNEKRRIEQIIRSSAHQWNGISKLINALDVDYLYNLRAADEEVIITYPKLNSKRKRELRYAIKHCLLGQVISYRGLFFNVYEFAHG